MRLSGKLFERFASRLMDQAGTREPDKVIGHVEDPLLLRWHFVRTRWFGVYLHLFLRSDHDVPHSHPWLFNVSMLLKGQYTEHILLNSTTQEQIGVIRRAGQIVPRWGAGGHRIELTDGPCWTLFIVGPAVMDWWFICGGRTGKVPWRKFNARVNRGLAGCGDE